MNLQRFPKIVGVLVTLAGLAFAIFCGKVTGSGNAKLLFVLFGVIVTVAMCVLLRSNIWLLMPICWPLIGQIPAIPLPFSVRDISVLLAFGGFLALVALKVVRYRSRFEFVDLLLLVNILYIASVFARNPVGLGAFSSDRVGGKHYFDVIVGVLAYWVLRRVRVAPERVTIIPVLTIFGWGMVGAINLISYLIPSSVPFLLRFYSGISLDFVEMPGGAAASAETAAVTGRISYLSGFGQTLSLFLCSFFPPLSLLSPLRTKRFLAFCLAIFAIVISGHRSIFVAAVAAYFIATYVRKGLHDLAITALCLAPLIAVLLAGQGTLFELPLVAQRTLSFLPAKWNPIATEDAKASSEWRFQIWQIVLGSNKYIENRLLGDGFGLTRRELEINMLSYYGNDTSGGQESAMVAGAFHSGPLSAVRFVGVVGLVLYYLLMISMARYAIRMFRAARHTGLFPLALFIGIPLIWEPIHYTLIFGGFETGFPNTVYALGMLKLVSSSVEACKAGTREKAHSFQPPPSRVEKEEESVLIPATLRFSR